MFGLEITALGWLGIAFVAAIVEVSIPHFGSAFVGAGAIAAAAAALLGFSVSVQLATFIIVMVVSLVTLRTRLLGRLGGPGVPSRTEPLLCRVPDGSPQAGARAPRAHAGRGRGDRSDRPSGGPRRVCLPVR